MARLALDLQLFAQEKTEKATPKRRQEARKKGQVARSADLPSSLIFLSVFLFLFFAGGLFAQKFISLFRLPLEQWLLLDVSETQVVELYKDVLLQFAAIVLPLMGVSVAAGVIGNYVQFGFLFTSEPLIMKAERLDPIQGAKRIFSRRALVEFLKSIVKFIVVGAVVALVLWHNADDIFTVSRLPVESAAALVGKLVVQMGLLVALTLVALSIGDYFYQRYDHERNLRMSKQDIKDELKKTEGSPEMRSRIKQKQRQLAMRRMMQEVPKADVVITNPTHYAVALKYDGESMEAPQVVAKGADFLAMRIRDIARAHDVPLMENKHLARALYNQAAIGETIPAELFQAVAEVLAYVYRMRHRR